MDYILLIGILASLYGIGRSFYIHHRNVKQKEFLAIAILKLVKKNQKLEQKVAVYHEALGKMLDEELLRSYAVETLDKLEKIDKADQVLDSTVSIK